MKGDIKLYFKGLWAKTLQTLGALITSFGLLSFLLFDLWIAIIIILLGIALLVYGSALKFKFKRESGYLLYQEK